MAGNDIPEVVIIVKNGIAEIRGVSGEVRIAMIDLDREGQEVSPAELETAIEFGTYTGGPEEITAAIAEGREALEHFLEAPSPGMA